MQSVQVHVLLTFLSHVILGPIAWEFMSLYSFGMLEQGLICHLHELSDQLCLHRSSLKTAFCIRRLHRPTSALVTLPVYLIHSFSSGAVLWKALGFLFRIRCVTCCGVVQEFNDIVSYLWLCCRGAQHKNLDIKMQKVSILQLPCSVGVSEEE